VPGILTAARKDAEQRFANAAPTLLATLTHTIDARLQSVSVGAAASFGAREIMLAAGAGATGVLPAYLLARFALWGAGKLLRRKPKQNPPAAPGGPRPDTFHTAG
jgi:hypothetical protein